jgi:alpha-galactosidase
MTRETGVKVCGLCHGHYGVYEIAQTIGLDISDLQHLTWQAPGLNHNIWLTHFIYKDRNAYPLIDAWIETKAEDYWRSHIANRTHDIQMSRGAVHQYLMYGVFPIGDTVRDGGWWYHTDLAAKKHWFGEPFGGPDTDVARPIFVENLEKRLAEMTRLANDPQASLVESLGATKTREQQVPIIDALVNNHEGQFQVNVPNNGALKGIPDDVVVELPAIINKKGILPIRVGALPQKVMLEHVLPEWLEMERGLHAFKTGDRSMLLWGALNAHQTESYDQAAAMLEEMLAMAGHEELDDYFRYPAGEKLLLAKHSTTSNE